jgi:calcium-dependent protein kinase
LPIEDPYLKSHPDLYEKMQKDLKRLIYRSHLPIFDPSCYEIEKKIGEGTYGAIFRVINIKTKKKYAMKKIITNNIISLKYLKSEFEISYQNIHPHILSIYGINIKCFDSHTFSLCVLMDLGDKDWDVAIAERLRNGKNYTEQELISIFKQLASALIYLQRDKKIAHRDIKPENVLIFKNTIYKIADFGEAKATKFNNKINTLRGTDIYMSPLLYNGLKASKEDVQHNLYKSDVFSLGYTLLYAISLNYDIINELRDLDDSQKIKKILYEKLKPRFSNNFIEVILRMINPDEKTRIDFIGLEKLIKDLL